LQLEYEPPFSIADRAAVAQEAHHVWPFFAPYVEAKGVQSAILTATNLRWKGWWPVVWSTRMRHFGIILRRDDKGVWWAEGDTLAFPAADPSGVPRITESDGSPVPFNTDLR
jgi:hypothetical protein